MEKQYLQNLDSHRFEANSRGLRWMNLDCYFADADILIMIICFPQKSEGGGTFSSNQYVEKMKQSVHYFILGERISTIYSSWIS
jgi:hypothetical protein